MSCSNGDEWSGEISWRDRSGFKNAKHRPDLIACHRGGGRIAIEVELTKKSAERLRAILSRHAVWRSLGQSGGVIYVCARRGRVQTHHEVCRGRRTREEAVVSASN